LGLELSNATSSICWIFVPLFCVAHNPKVVSSNLTPATMGAARKILSAPFFFIVILLVSASKAAFPRFLPDVAIAAEELKPHYVRECGALPEAASTELNGIVGKLRSLVSKLDCYPALGGGQDLKVRLQQLEQKSNDLGLLSKIEQIYFFLPFL
jgi:hypothetical protein